MSTTESLVVASTQIDDHYTPIYSAPEPVAIIGIGCRFPGGARGPQAFWDLLSRGVDAIGEVPEDRWSIDCLYDPDNSIPGTINNRYGGFVGDIDQFDAQFFGISPREAARMDPQQRVLLEVAWEAMEDAGQVSARLAGGKVGVFIGISGHDYWNLQLNPANRYRVDAHTNTGGSPCIAANRISFVFDFRGPSIAFDTACSSALVSVVEACRSLWRRESTLALAGGVNALFSPEATIGFNRLAMLSPDGRCKAFDAGANGYVRSEGAGIVVLNSV